MRSKREISSRRSRETKEIHDMMHRILKICMEQTRTEQAYLLLEISHFMFKSGSINIYGILGRGRVPDLLKLWELSSTVIEKGTKVILPDGNEVVWPAGNSNVYFVSECDLLNRIIEHPADKFGVIVFSF